MEQLTHSELRKLLERKIKPIAKKRFLELGLNEDEAKELIDEGIDSIFSKIFLIDKAINEKNFKALIQLTHSVKGVLLNLGLDSEAEAFKKIKHLYENGEKNTEIEAQTRKALQTLLGKGE